MIWKYRIVFILILSVYCLHPESTKINFDHLTVDNGLSQGAVYAIIQDSREFMWFGTKDGLNRYDGYKFEIYRHIPGNNSSLSNNYILTLLEDKNNYIWIGTNGGGLCRFDPRTNLFKTFRSNKNKPYSISGNIITSICEDREGFLWIGTKMNGLSKLDPVSEKFERIKIVRSVDIDINYIRVIKNSNIYGKSYLWIGSENGLFLFNKNTLKSKSYIFKDLENYKRSGRLSITDILENMDNTIWISTFGGGIIKYKPAEKRYIQFIYKQKRPESDLAHNYMTISKDKEGNVWFGTNMSGIRLYRKKTNNFLSIKNQINESGSIIYKKILSIYRSNSGIIWVGTDGKGISYYYKNSVNFSIIANSYKKLQFSSVRTITEDINDDLWISGYGGINQFDKSTKYFKNEIMKGSDVHSILHDPDNSDILWIGTEGSGIFRFNKKTNSITDMNYTLTKGVNKVLGQLIYIIIPDKNNILWIGTELGLNKYDKDKNIFTHYTYDPGSPNSLTNGEVIAIYKENDHNLWIGTTTGGISLFSRDNNTFKNYISNPDDIHTISSNNILSFYEDRNGILWIGTGGGLNKFNKNNKAFSSYSEKDGLPNDTIYGILEDEKGNLWLSTNSGLSKFNPKTEVFKNYDSGYGLQSNEFNTSSYLKGRDNTLYFGGVNGVTYFNPDDIKENPYKPPMVLTSFKKFNKEVPLDEDISFKKEIKLNYRDYMFSFEFSALSYYNSYKNRYAYKIEGLHKEWVNIGNRRDISIANLTSGNYTLRIKGSNNSDIWNEQDLSIKLIITPPFWRTNWFRVLVLIVFLSFIALVIFWRARNMRKQNFLLSKKIKERTKELEISKEEAEIANKVKSDFLANISHEIRTPLNAVLGYSEILRESIKDNEQSEYINSIISSGKSLMGLFNDILDISKIEADRLKLYYEPININSIIKDIKSIFSFEINKKDLDLIFKVDTNLPAEIIMDQLRLRQILFNLVGNAVKFTEHGYIKISLKMIKKKTHSDSIDLEIIVDDNGIGIPKDQQKLIFSPFVQKRRQNNKYGGAGLGLSISKRLIELMNGHISIKTKSSRGTTFVVVFKDVKIANTKNEEIIKKRNIKLTDQKKRKTQKNENTNEIASILKKIELNWKKVNQRFIIEEIEIFGTKIDEIGNEYKLESLCEWSALVIDQAKKINIKELTKTMGEFNTIISELKISILRDNNEK